MNRISFVIEENEDGTFAIIENPQSKNYGPSPFAGDKIIRSPYKTKEEARKRMKERGEIIGYKPVEIMHEER